MEKFQFRIETQEIIKLQNPEDFPKNGTYIYVFHADKIPPHIGFVHGDFYSLKAKGIDLALNVFKINQLVLQKKIPTLIFEIQTDNLSQDKILPTFQKYGSFLEKGKTCLHPINELLFKDKQHEKIGDLIKALSADDRIIKVYGANLKEDFQGIREYSKNEIEKRIFELQC